MFDALIVGGGAAGYYAAIHLSEANPNLRIAILERGKEVLTKVKVSGGGRCNVTHAEFDPAELVKHYPRGEKELLGPFHTHSSGDIISFFEARGVALKIESDGRMFPVSDSSQTIIDCFISETERLGIQLIKNTSVTNIERLQIDKKSVWQLTTTKGEYQAAKVLIATGSNPKIWNLVKQLGHSIVPAVPSLFTFNIDDDRIEGIQGISAYARVSVLRKATNAKIEIALASKPADKVLLTSEGDLLITHWGMSGPAILKLSAWGALLLHEKNYKFNIEVNWLPNYHSEAIISLLMEIKIVEAKKTILRTKAVELPRRLWINLVRAAGISAEMTWAEATKELLQNLADQLTKSVFQVDGKSTFKEEFVTAGGVHLKEINFKTYESKLLPNLYFAGEVINVDAITGGFNFQNAWTGAYIAAQAMAK